MKKIFNIIIAGTALMSAVSCADMLNTAPSDQIASGNMWTTPELAAKGMNGLYETFFNRKQNKGTQVRSENLDGLNKYGIEALGFCTDYYSNNYPIYLLYNETKRANDWQINHEWQFVYTIIHATNDAIANLGKAGLDEATYQRYICEAKFLRAWAYYRANMFWQGVPIYLEPVSNEQCTKTQSSAAEVWNVVITDLTDCINNQYMPDNTLTENYGRPSKGAAYALRGMAYMWMARGSQGYEERWDVDDPGLVDPEQGVEPLHPEYFDNAIADFEKVSECGYDLWDDGTPESYINFFEAANEKDNEMIFAIQYDEASGFCDNIQQAVGASDTYTGWDEVKPSADFVDYYQNSDGTPFSWFEWAEDWNEAHPDQQPIDWDELTPKQRAVFFFRDGLKSNPAYEDEQHHLRTQAIGICGQDIFDKYYLDEGNEARIKTAYDNRDPRLKQTIVTPYEPVDCYTANYNNDENMIGKQMRWPLYERGTDGGDFWLEKRASAFYCFRKYVRFTKGELIDRARCYTDFPLIRYTDVLLQWAEALIERERFAEAANKINDVRSRAGMPPISAGSKEEMRKAVRYERRVEFPVEAINFFDENRWGTYRKTKFKNQDIHGGQSWWGDNTVEYAWYWQNNIWPWSIPMAEHQRNPNLRTSPGWIY